MLWSSFVALALIAPSHAMVRFGCSQLVTQRLDPLVNPGMLPSPHVHQIIGGNSFNTTMNPANHDIPALSTCTTCQPSEDFSNYWTAVLYFRARNGTFKRVPQKPNPFFEGQDGGFTVYYMQDQLADMEQKSKVTAFQPGFRMIVGDPLFKTRQELDRYPQLTYTCLQTVYTRYPEFRQFPSAACPAGIMTNHRFPTCWDGVNLDTSDHRSHMAYPVNGTFEAQAPCPESHPVRMPQLLYETMWSTELFNDPNEWPEDGSQPFIWSFSDKLGYGTHGDYVFGWKADALQKIMDEPCYTTVRECETMKTQSIEQMNACSLKPIVDEDVDGWLTQLPGQPMME